MLWYLISFFAPLDLTSSGLLYLDTLLHTCDLESSAHLAWFDTRPQAHTSWSDARCRFYERSRLSWPTMLITSLNTMAEP